MLVDDGEGDDVILSEELRDLFLVNMRLHVDELGLKDLGDRRGGLGERAKRAMRTTPMEFSSLIRDEDKVHRVGVILAGGAPQGRRLRSHCR